MAGQTGHLGRSSRFPTEPFELAAIDWTGDASVIVRLASDGLAVALEYQLTPEGVLRSRASVTNTGDDVYRLEQLNVVLPLPARASEILDFAGHWAGERKPQRRAMQTGAWVREIRHGRPGHDAPYVLAAGTPSFGFRAGEVWGIHFGWSGNQRLWVESQIFGLAVAGVGELFDSGEVVLDHAESYTSPWVFGSWSARGLDGISERFHGYLRRERGFASAQHPVILNTWEAVYFDQKLERLKELADAAAAVGAERFVLDDGWMSGRVDDAHALGDWRVDPQRWPAGLHPLVGHVRSLGLGFGLWVEPEMVNLDSELMRDHPEWMLRDGRMTYPLPARHQFVLNLAIPEAFAAVLAQLSALLDEYPIEYLKWDHNRDLMVTSTRQQTLAAYRLMDELGRRHPHVEIESCAAGGGRIDFGILERATRVWASDTNDPLERQSIYRWTSLLVPPEVIGVHLGAATAHTTHRTHSPSFRFATALFGWAGIEWDLTAASADERDTVAAWLRVYKELRPIIHGGTVVRADRADESFWVHGVVKQDASDAVFALVAMTSGRNAFPAPVLLPGLDPERRYAVTVVDLGAEVPLVATLAPEWMLAGTFTMSGRALEQVGFAAPPLAPEQALVLRVTAV